MKVRGILNSQRITNMFGAVGYSLLIINCAIVAGAVLLWLINSGYGNAIGLQPEAPAETYAPVGDTAPSGALSVVLDIIAYTIAIVMGLAVIFCIDYSALLAWTGWFVLYKKNCKLIYRGADTCDVASS